MSVAYLGTKKLNEITVLVDGNLRRLEARVAELQGALVEARKSPAIESDPQ